MSAGAIIALIIGIPTVTIIGLFAAVVLLMALTTPRTTSAPTADVPAVGIGTVATTPNFEYVVTDQPEEADQVTGSRDTHTAQGRWIIVPVTITNTGQEPAYLYGHGIRLVDTDGRTYDDDTEATFAVDNTTYTEQLNPGQSGDFKVVFDVPTDREPAQLIITEERRAAAEDTAVMSLVD
jgi:hypothetical protein